MNQLTDPITYRSACGCLQRESGALERCPRHLLADWQAAQTLAADPPSYDDAYAA